MDMRDANTPHLDVTIDAYSRLVIRCQDQPLMAIDARNWLVETVNRVSKRHVIAWDFFAEHGRHVTRGRRWMPVGSGHWTLVDQSLNRCGRLSIRQPEPDHLVFTFEAPDAHRVGFRWWGSSTEVLYGWGSYNDGPAARPGRWATWTEEGPVGLGLLAPWLRWTGRVPLPRGYRTTYAPAPFWVSSLGYAGWLENTERVDWSLQGARRSMRVWSHHFTLHLLAGPDLRQVLARRRELLGGPPVPPLWVFAPWLDAVQGEEVVLDLAERARRRRIPASAMWVEDWMGSWQDPRRFWMRPLSHQISPHLYPHLEQMAQRLHQQGYKLLGYVCPEVAVDTPLYQEASTQGHLVRDAAGALVDINILGWHHGELDLARVDTRQWVKERIFSPLAQVGFDGWMADFGEYLPPESRLADGSTGWTSHNRYPLLWQSLNREFWDEERPDGDYTFFVRSGGLLTPATAPVMWGGDNDTDWDPGDGLPAVIPQALSAGLMGNIIWGTDIAGYMTFGLTRPSSRELYLRWTALASLLPVMRTHHGTARPRNWHWTRDLETEQLFARFARLHMLLLPYFHHLAAEAHTNGLPLIRPLWLEYPGSGFDDVHTQFLLGTMLLAAPVTSLRRHTAGVALPPDGWHDWWSDVSWQGPGPIRVPAPLGQIPLLIRRGAALPCHEGLESGGRRLGFLETVASPQGRLAAERSVSLLIVGPMAEEQLILPGGTLRIAAASDDDSAPVRPATPPQFTDHAPWLSRPGVVVNVPANGSVSTTGLRFRWSGSRDLEVTLRRLDP